MPQIMDKLPKIFTEITELTNKIEKEIPVNLLVFVRRSYDHSQYGPSKY
ncbi:hypothetical protein [uncultured Maribacter sp.]|tara:strand:- start:1344 stop:1490 length:147 start_codon:yes stop_codon:yes gene_type:complete